MTDRLPSEVFVSGCEIAVGGWDEKTIRSEAAFKVARTIMKRVKLEPLPNQGDARVFRVIYE